MDIGFIGLGKMGFPMARRLIEARHRPVLWVRAFAGTTTLMWLSAIAHSQGAGLSIAISASTSMRGRTTAY